MLSVCMFQQTEMSRAAMRPFVILILSVPVIQAQNDYGVTYRSTEICAVKGSTVEISCTYTYPSSIKDRETTVEETFWFIKQNKNEPVDLRTVSQYAGRVDHQCENNICTLRITDVRESDSAEYWFRFITNQQGGRDTGSPGVRLTVTGFQIQQTNSKECKVESCTLSELKCHSSCRLPDQTSYVWYGNGEKIWGKTSSSYSKYFYSEESSSCAVRGHEDVAAPSVCVYGHSCNVVNYNDRRICAFKGSSVNISCTYNSYRDITSKHWFRSEYWWQSLSQSAGRVQVFEPERGHSTLRITELTETDSAEYHFKFTARSFEWRSSLPGTTLIVTEPDLQVQVILSPTGPKLICHSRCLTDRSSFIWYKNGSKVPAETSSSYSGHVDPADTFECGVEGHRSPAVYAPVVPKVSISPSGDIMRNSSVTLNCSSDANPAAKYTWYKENQTLVSKKPQLVFSSIQSSDSGEYYCTAENQLGRRTSENISVDVKYAPELPSVSVSPSAEIVEGSSVTLTCSSDANPAAHYTWYKENQTLSQGQGRTYHFSSISSKDSGNYYCKSENQYREISSSSVSIDVQYAPKLPSVSVSPSAEIVEGSSVTLTCSSDANPAATYTWYKEGEDSPEASGQIFNITDVRAEHSGNYYCEAQNTRGRHNSTIDLTVATGAGKLAIITTTTAVLLVLLLLTVFLLMRIKKSRKQPSESGERPDNRPQLNTNAVYDSQTAAAQRQPAEQQDDIHYASISISVNQDDAVYSNISRAQAHRQTKEEEEEDHVDYSTVKIVTASSASGPRHQEDEEDFFALYSTVKKDKVN